MAIFVSPFWSCGCQWDLEHEEIKWQDVPHPFCSHGPPTVGHAAVALVCMRSWLQTPGTLSVRSRTPKPQSSVPSQTFGNSLRTSSEFLLYFRVWNTEGWFLLCWASFRLGHHHVNRQAPSPEIQKSNFPMQLEPLVPKLVREEWDTKVKCLLWQSKALLFSKALSSKISCTLVL